MVSVEREKKSKRKPLTTASLGLGTGQRRHYGAPGVDETWKISSF